MKKLIAAVLFALLFGLVGCGESSNHNSKITLMGTPQTTGVNPNSLAYQSADKVLERKNKIELSKIEADAKIKIEEIRSKNQLHIAKINAEAQKSIAETDLKGKVKSSEIDAKARKESMEYTVYIVLAVVLVVLIALILLYLNGKKNRELKKQLHDEQLRHEQFLKEKELEEQRVHKLLELVATGKVAKAVEKEVILSIAKPKKDADAQIIIDKKD